MCAAAWPGGAEAEGTKHFRDGTHVGKGCTQAIAEIEEEIRGSAGGLAEEQRGAKKALQAAAELPVWPQ